MFEKKGRELLQLGTSGRSLSDKGERVRRQVVWVTGTIRDFPTMKGSQILRGLGRATF